MAKNGIWSSKFFHEIELFDFTSFYGLEFFKYFGPLYYSYTLTGKIENEQVKSSLTVIMQPALSNAPQ